MHPAKGIMWIQKVIVDKALGLGLPFSFPLPASLVSSDAQHICTIYNNILCIVVFFKLLTQDMCQQDSMSCG